MSRPILQVDLLVESFNYKAWSDRRTLDAIARIDAEAFPASLAFALQQLNHMAIVEELFRARLLGEPAPHQQTNSEVVPGYDVLRRRLEDSAVWFAGYVAELPLERRGEWLRFRFADGRDGGMTRQEILFHIVNHGTYHRGTIGHALDLAGAPRPADTYTLYVHAAQPERRGGSA
ncbi:DinB family protein [Pseudomonas aeruginosa]|uniref:DinB family protein n=1 Tax=Pseudomonas aeruginosa TaxID=287 RepID=UPI0026F02D51|nr:DinB family protein [Pseudomonas aeruginosa]